MPSSSMALLGELSRELLGVPCPKRGYLPKYRYALDNLGERLLDALSTPPGSRAMWPHPGP